MKKANSTPRATTLRLPSRLVVDTIRLAELMGTPFQVELAVNLAAALERYAAAQDRAPARELAKRLPAEPEAWEPVRIWLPAWQADMLRELAAHLRLPLGRTLAVLLAPVVDEHLMVATYALEHGVSFLKARHIVTALGAASLPAAPVSPKGSRRRAPKKRTA
jgi:hypothetical protein